MAISSFDDHMVTENGSPILNVTSSGVLDWPLVQHDDHGGTASPQGIGTRYHLHFAGSGGWVQIPNIMQKMPLLTIANFSANTVTIKNADGSTMGTLAAGSSTSVWIECGFLGLTWGVVRSAGWTSA